MGALCFVSHSSIPHSVPAACVPTATTRQQRLHKKERCGLTVLSIIPSPACHPIFVGIGLLKSSSLEHHHVRLQARRTQRTRTIRQDHSSCLEVVLWPRSRTCGCSSYHPEGDFWCLSRCHYH